MFIKVSRLLIIIVISIQFVACASMICSKCHVDEQRISDCINSLEAGNYQEGTKEYSALKSLKTQFEIYKSSGDCSRFITFYEAHVKQYCTH